MNRLWERIPDELRYVPKWCVAAPDKSPYTVQGRHASVTAPSTWSDWYSASTAAAAWGNGAGIGFILGEEDVFTCIDLDVKPDTPQEQLDRFWKIVQAFDSYTERSRSGKGLHIWIKGKVGTGCRRDGVEVYSQQRFIICTGDVVIDKPVEHRQELLDLLVQEIRSAAQTNTIELQEVQELESDEIVWQRAADASNGDKYKALWAGDWAGMGYPSQSEADLSLLSMLAFYSKSNEQVRRLFRLSGLGQREKAQKNNRYLDRTLGMIRGRQQREEAQAAAAQANATQLVQRMPERQLLPVETPSTLDWPPGWIGEIAQYLYSIAPRPVREVAIISALGFFAGLMGRTYNISGSGLNLYLVLVARSAVGKEAMHSGISKLTHRILLSNPIISNYIDFADYASGPALVKSLAQRTSFVNVAGEWGRKLRKMSDDHTEGPMASLRTVMTNLYQKSSAGTIVGGIGYSDKEKDVKATNGVAFSMIGETTPDTFYESLTNTMMQDGFMSRFIVVEYAGLRPELNPAQSAQLHDDHIGRFVNILDTIARCPPDAYVDVAMSREAQDMLDGFDKECDKQINLTEDESWRQMWNRAHLKTLKIAGLLACADNHMTPIVTAEHAEWALDIVKRDIRIMSRKMTDGDVGDGDMVRERKLLSTLRQYLQEPMTKGYGLPDEMRKAGVVARKYLQIRLQRTNAFVKHKLGQTAGLDMTIRSLTDSGYIVEVAKDKIPTEWNFHGKCYRIVSLPDVL